jgi:hypothetical protein
MTPAHVPATEWSLHEHSCTRRFGVRRRDRRPLPALGAGGAALSLDFLIAGRLGIKQ